MATKPKSKKTKNKRPTYKDSKEFQVKIARELGTSDTECLRVVQEILQNLQRGGWISDLTPPKCGWGISGTWRRHGERFDTELGLFKSNKISLATEKWAIDDKGRTKLKCKLHNFVPELLYPRPDKAGRPEKAYCYPSVADSGIKTRFKLEQDVHFNNCKYCATGYFTLRGHDREFNRVSDFLAFYPKLAKVPGLDPKMKLELVKDWNELVFDDVSMKVAGMDVESALVTRRERVGDSWVESELAFKLKEPKGGWDHKALMAFAHVYQHLFECYGGRYFIREPSIFYFHAPV